MVTEAFKNAISAGNVLGIRIMMKDSLLVDPTFVEFEEMSGLSHGMSGLYDSHDGLELKTDKSEWTKDYMDKVMVEVVINFSHERLNHLKEVVRYLRPPTAEELRKAANSNNSGNRQSQSRSSYQEQKYHDQRTGSYRGAKIGAGALVGAVVGGAVAAAASTTVAAGIVLGAAVGGAAMAFITKGGKQL